MPRVHPSRDTSLLRHSYLIIYYINNKSIYVSHLLETLAQSAGAEVVKKAALLAEGNEWIDSSGCSL